MAKTNRSSIKNAQTRTANNSNKTNIARRRTKNKKKTNSKQNYWIIGIISAFILFILLLNILPTNTKKEDKEKIKELALHIPVGFNSFGIDVSHHQGTINWVKIFQNRNLDTLLNFVYCKATEGTTFTDEKWIENRQSLNELGIRNGAYHFFNPDTDPVKQAEHFISIWKPRDIDLPPVLDVEIENKEKNDVTLKKSMNKWLFHVEKKTGHHPIIYTQDNFFMKKFKNDFLNYNFWIASYSKKPFGLNYKRIVHWQYSENGEIPGISEKVDLNVSKQKL